MQFKEAADFALKEHAGKVRGFIARRILRLPGFAPHLESMVREKMGLNANEAIDWSKVDWAELAKIVLMILAAFGVL